MTMTPEERRKRRRERRAARLGKRVRFDLPSNRLPRSSDCQKKMTWHTHADCTVRHCGCPCHDDQLLYTHGYWEVGDY